MLLKSLIGIVLVAFGTVSAVIVSTEPGMILTDLAVPYAGR